MIKIHEQVEADIQDEVNDVHDEVALHLDDDERVACDVCSLERIDEIEVNELCDIEVDEEVEAVNILEILPYEVADATEVVMVDAFAPLHDYMTVLSDVMLLTVDDDEVEVLQGILLIHSDEEMVVVV